MTHKLVFATHNAHKLEEVRHMLAGVSVELVGAGEVGAPDVEETGQTFAQNALIKALAAYRYTGMPALADDSGLCIEALGNAPGVYSHRFASQHGDFPAVFDEINRQLAGKTREAFFECVMAVVFSEEESYVFRGVVRGTLIENPRGADGFGYDPIFVPNGYTETLAQMGAEAKNKISHRYLALKQVQEFLKNR